MRQAQARLGSSHLTIVGAYIRSTCAVCGKVFMRTTEHVYKDCCSWTCLRATEKEDGRRHRKKPEMDEDAVMARIRKCEDRLAHYRQAANNAGFGTNERNSAQKGVREWTCKLEDAQELLEKIREKTYG